MSVKDFYEKIDSGGGIFEIDQKKTDVIDLANSYGNIDKILDVGVGNGITLDNIKANEKYGIDINSKHFERLEKLGIKSHIQDIQENFPYEDNTFDVVISEDVIEHLIMPEKTLSEIYRVLKRGGIFVGTVPNHFNLYHRLCYLFAMPEKSFLFRDAKHISDNFWTKKGLTKLFEDVGFKDVKLEFHIGHFTKLWSSLMGRSMIWKVYKK